MVDRSAIGTSTGHVLHHADRCPSCTIFATLQPSGPAGRTGGGLQRWNPAYVQVWTTGRAVERLPHFVVTCARCVELPTRSVAVLRGATCVRSEQSGAHDHRPCSLNARAGPGRHHRSGRSAVVQEPPPGVKRITPNPTLCRVRGGRRGGLVAQPLEPLLTDERTLPAMSWAASFTRSFMLLAASLPLAARSPTSPFN